MSLSDCSLVQEGEFAYHTRLVVYKYLGLIPARSFSQTEGSVADESTGSSTRSVPWELSSLPQVSLIDKLKESEEHYAKNKRLCDELTKKVKRISSESPKSESQRSYHASSSRESHTCLPKSLLHEIRVRGGFKVETIEDNMQQMTVIQKQSKVRIYIDQIKNIETHETVSFRDGKVRFQGDDSQVEDVTLGKFINKENLSQNPVHELSQVSAQKSIGRQISGTSCSSRRCSAYIDINEVDEDTLKSIKSLPNSAVSLKKELCEAINQVESEYASFLNQSSDASPAADGSSFSRSSSDVDIDAVYRVADCLRVIGDRLNDQGLDLTVEELVSRFYAEDRHFQELFREHVSSLVEDVAFGWNKVALLLNLGQRLMLRLFESGFHEVSYVGEMTANFIQQHLGEFIITNGGWFGINDLELMEQPLDVPNFMDSIEEDVEISRNGGVSNGAADVPTAGTISPILPSSSCGTTVRDGSVGSPSNARSRSDSQDFIPTPTWEPRSFEVAGAEKDERLPDQQQGAAANGEKEPTVKGNEFLLRSDSDLLEGDGKNLDGPKPNMVVDARCSLFDFISGHFGRSGAERILKLSLLIGGSLLLWKFLTRKR